MTVVHSKLKEYYLSIGIEEEVSKKISITIDEMVSNIILYGYEDTESHNISIRLETNTTDITLEIVDDGMHFDPLEYLRCKTKTRDMEQAGGVGLSIVRNMASEMKYKRIEHQNILFITIPHLSNILQ